MGGLTAVARANESSSRPAIAGTWRAIAAAAVTGVLMVLAFPPFDLDLLIWVTLVPIFLAARGAGGKRGFLLGLIAGVVIEAGGFHWICYAIIEFTGFHGWLVFIAVALFLAWLAWAVLIWGALGWLLGRARTPAALHLAIAAWVGVEHLFPRLFPWHVGGAVWARDWLRQGADIFGAGGLTYAVLLANGLIALGIESLRGRCRFPRWTLAATLAVVIALNVYGALRLGALERALGEVPPLEVAVVQPNLDPREKTQHFLELLAATAVWSRELSPDLVVLPEGMDGIRMKAGEDPLAGYSPPEGGTVFDGFTAPLVFGGGSESPDGRPMNTAVYVRPERPGIAERASVYHKNRRLLFGEYVPLEEHLPDWFRRRIAVGTLAPGTTSPLLAIEAPAGRTSRFRLLICYEAVLPGFVRKTARGADFLVNITEDLWYNGDLWFWSEKRAHSGQHVSVLMLRAVENRVPLLRCANGGPSGVVEPTGSFEKRTGALRAERGVVELSPGRFFSLYRAGGHAFPVVPLLVAAGFAAFRARRASKAGQGSGSD